LAIQAVPDPIPFDQTTVSSLSHRKHTFMIGNFKIHGGVNFGNLGTVKPLYLQVLYPHIQPSAD
jgi:hypothetical protein